jgi:hypothetical protein
MNDLEEDEHFLESHKIIVPMSRSSSGVSSSPAAAAQSLNESAAQRSHSGLKLSPDIGKPTGAQTPRGASAPPPATASIPAANKDPAESVKSKGKTVHMAAQTPRGGSAPPSASVSAPATKKDQAESVKSKGKAVNTGAQIPRDDSAFPPPASAKGKAKAAQKEATPAAVEPSPNAASDSSKKRKAQSSATPTVSEEKTAKRRSSTGSKWFSQMLCQCIVGSSENEFFILHLSFPSQRAHTQIMSHKLAKVGFIYHFIFILSQTNAC